MQTFRWGAGDGAVHAAMGSWSCREAALVEVVSIGQRERVRALQVHHLRDTPPLTTTGLTNTHGRS